MPNNQKEYDEICKEVKALLKSSGSSNITQAWAFLILKELRCLNENIETLLSKLSKEEVDTKSEAQKRVEQKFGKSLAELLREREGKSLRNIADEFGVSKATISNWKSKL